MVTVVKNVTSDDEVDGPQNRSGCSVVDPCSYLERLDCPRPMRSGGNEDRECKDLSRLLLCPSFRLRNSASHRVESGSDLAVPFEERHRRSDPLVQGRFVDRVAQGVNQFVRQIERADAEPFGNSFDQIGFFGAAWCFDFGFFERQCKSCAPAGDASRVECGQQVCTVAGQCLFQSFRQLSVYSLRASATASWICTCTCGL